MFDTCTLKDIALAITVLVVILPGGLLLWTFGLSLALECYWAVKEERSKRQ